jgi:hypothetical protein
LSGASIVARINRAELGEHDARILGSLLISQCKGQIIVPDFGFYARNFHASLIREGRLIAGVYTLSALDEQLRQMCLLMETEAAGCTYEDAQALAKYEGPTCRIQMRSMPPCSGRWLLSPFPCTRHTAGSASSRYASNEASSRKIYCWRIVLW